MNILKHTYLHWHPKDYAKLNLSRKDLNDMLRIVTYRGVNGCRVCMYLSSCKGESFPCVGRVPDTLDKEVLIAEYLKCRTAPLLSVVLKVRETIRKKRRRKRKKNPCIRRRSITRLLVTGLVCLTVGVVTTYLICAGTTQEDIPVEPVVCDTSEVTTTPQPEEEAPIIMYVPVELPPPNAYTITDEERLAIERCIAGEVRYGNLDDMIGVAQVIRDKLEHPNTDLYHGTSVADVLANGHYTEWDGDPSNFPFIAKAVSLVFDDGFRLFDDVVTIYFTPESSDPEQVELLRKYVYVGSTTYFEFHSDKLIETEAAND